MTNAPNKDKNAASEMPDPEHEDNRAWALKWDGAALVAMREKSGDKDRWGRP